ERPNSFFLGESGLKLAASQLYDTLYKMDEMNLTQIVIERIPETELGRSIMDRLKRSANQ
ncbi:MAG: L-threonylcarbamoyladenylate synthase type 1 TsaC, partial [Bacteroidetes bacterium]